MAARAFQPCSEFMVDFALDAGGELGIAVGMRING